MLRRIRVAMEVGSVKKMGGEMEADEAFIGGLAKNMHKHKREKAIEGRGATGKAIVMGIIGRGVNGKTNRVRAKAIPNTQRGTIEAEMCATVVPDAALYTDSASA